MASLLDCRNAWAYNHMAHQAVSDTEGCAALHADRGLMALLSQETSKHRVKGHEFYFHLMLTGHVYYGDPWLGTTTDCKRCGLLVTYRGTDNLVGPGDSVLGQCLGNVKGEG